jgi:peptidoglycan/xylan/chitin deacetylase (PgdA/CDA1 family)
MGVSVVIPARDAAETIGDALASLGAQSYSAWEAVVVENGSRDHTAEIVEAAAARDERIRLVRSQAAGVSEARNAGIADAAHDWLLFLDADDELVPDALSVLTAAAAAGDAAWGGWIRRSERGHELPEHPDDPRPDLFEAFARRCVFAIHCCVIRRALVEEVGGFDPALTTCEDWDLWQRVARAGARFTMVEGHHAIYRVRPDAATANAARLLADGLTVIARGHAPDPRVPHPEPGNATGRPVSERPGAELTFAPYPAGIALARGGDPDALLRHLGDREPAVIDPVDVAHHLFAGVVSHAEKGADSWLQLRSSAAVERLLLSIEHRSFSRHLVRSVLTHLDRLIASHTGAGLIGGRQTVEVDLEESLGDVVPVPAAERLAIRAVARGGVIGTVELPVCAAVVPAAVVADAIAAAHAWAIVAVFLDTPELDWDHFMRELLGRPDLPPDAAYDPSTDWGTAPSAGRDGEGRAAAELADLPVSPPPDGGPVVITCAGVPLGLLPSSPSTVGALMTAVVNAGGYELCRAAVREGLIGRRWNLPLRDLLQRGPAVPAMTDAVAPLIGRRAPTTLGTSNSRRAVIPAEAASTVVEMADEASEPVVGEGLAYVPEHIVAVAADREPSEPAVRVGRWSLRHDFEALFARGEDPWRYTSEYEQRKYDLTLELIGGQRIGDALELGCAEGHFTVQLAQRVERLTAADISAIALERARVRCAAADVDDIRFLRLDLGADPLPSGPFDLIVCSEVLYYLGDRPTLETVALALRDSLRHGGSLVHAHAHLLVDDPDEPGFDWSFPFGARVIGETLAATPGLQLEEEVVTDFYRVQRLRRVRRFRLRRRPTAHRREMSPPPRSKAARDFRAGGGRPRPAPAPAESARVPILMYHRISADSSDDGDRWCLSARAFEEQMAYLRDAGYRTIELVEWLDHAAKRRPLPGRPLVITFDDGDAAFPDLAWPVLDRHGFTANVFLPTDHVGGTSAWDARLGLEVPLLDWDVARALEAAGVRIGSHTAAHVPLTGAALADAAVEMARSRARLHKELGAPLDAIAFPFGDTDAAIGHLAGACGYVFGLSSRGGSAALTDEPLGLPRIEVSGDDTLASFIVKLG